MGEPVDLGLRSISGATGATIGGIASTSPEETGGRVTKSMIGADSVCVLRGKITGGARDVEAKAEAGRAACSLLDKARVRAVMHYVPT